MIKSPRYRKKKCEQQKNQIVPSVLLFVILIPLYFNQSLNAENDNPFISRFDETTTATIIVKERPSKVWKILTNYKETGMNMPDIQNVKVINEGNDLLMIENSQIQKEVEQIAANKPEPLIPNMGAESGFKDAIASTIKSAIFDEYALMSQFG